MDMRSELTRRTASEAVSERLRAEIQRGDLKPGTRLRQGEVAARFGVSTTPVREAFALLQAQGLVRIDPHRGAIVFLPTAEDAQELYEIRIALETLAIGRAVKNLDREELDELRAILDEMREVGTAEGWSDLHNRFHMLLYNGSGLPRLAMTIANLRDASSSYINMFVALNKGMDVSNEGHKEILEACEERDTRRAKKAVAQHLRTSEASLVASLEKG
ncbi:MAG TPA: GntR family transcriptional regulator [Actinomycetota bacterium]|nr:GntR family transcriptional regulator [Actinomycetota bacterium]